MAFTLICSWAFKFPEFPCQVLMPSDSLLSRNNSIDFWLGSHPLVNELGALRLSLERAQGFGMVVFLFSTSQHFLSTCPVVSL